MADNALERIRQIDQERAGLIEDARKEALARANQAIEELNALGFQYRLTEGGQGGRKQTRRGAGKVKDGPCPICEFKTEPPHDARAHRRQGDRKRPYTPRQLEELGYQRVD